MDFDTANVMLHIKRLVYSSIRLGYQYACDYPIVLGAGLLLLFLQRLCPSLFAFLVSFSPVFLLTALLLGALLSCGDPSFPVAKEEILEDQQTLSLQAKISITDHSIQEGDNVAVETLRGKLRTDSDEGHVQERDSDDNIHDTHYEEKSDAYMETDTVLSREVYVKERIYDDNFHDNHSEGENSRSIPTDNVICAESSDFTKSNVIVEREEHVGENSKKVELQEFRSTNPESGDGEVQTQYQLGEFMSSCWQPVLRQDPCSDSESDITESSSPDASMTDIIPMLEELHPLIDLGTGHPSLAIKDNMNSSSDNDEDDLKEDDEDVSSDEEDAEEWQKDDGNNWKDVIDLNSLDMEQDSKLDSVMELQRAKNILKFELDQRLMDLQAADATQKLKEASRFHVQVPSISAPRRNPFDLSNDSEDTIELLQIPGSAPSVLQRRNQFDLPFDQNAGHDSQLRETWTPRSYFPATRHKNHRNLYGQQSSYLQYHNGMKLERGEISGKDACDSHSDDDGEREENNGKLFGSLEAHLGEEIKILSAAISDAGVLEYGMNEGDKNEHFSNDVDPFPIMESMPSTLEVKGSVHAGSEQSILCSLSKTNSPEPHIVEADSIDEFNSLFKCRMEDVLVQSISEHSIDQPLVVKLYDELGDPLSSNSGMHLTEASSVEGLNSHLTRLKEKTCTISESTCYNESIQDISSKELPARIEHGSELPSEDRPTESLTSGVQHNTDSSELQIIEERFIEDINSFIHQHCEAALKNDTLIHQHFEAAQRNDTLEPPVQIIQKSTTDRFSSDPEQPGYFSEVCVLEPSSAQDLTALVKKPHGEVEIDSASDDPTIKLEDGSSSELHAAETNSVEDGNNLAKQVDKDSQVEDLSYCTIHELTAMKLEGKPSEPLTIGAELPVLEESSIDEMNLHIEQHEQAAQTQIPQSSEHTEAKSTEDVSNVLGS